MLLIAEALVIEIIATTCLTTAHDGGDNLPLPDQMELAQKCKSSNRPELCFSLRNRSKLLRPAQHISSAREFLL